MTPTSRPSTRVWNLQSPKRNSSEMSNYPISTSAFSELLRKMDISDISLASIRQCQAVGQELEAMAGEPIVHLEMGIPGINVHDIGTDAQKKALDAGKAKLYPSIAGIKPLKENASRFVKAFIDVDVDPKGIIPTVGSMNASFNLILECSQLNPEKDTILYLCPGFSAHGRQPDVLGIRNYMFDVYQYRGEKLREKLEQEFSSGRIAALLYSNPNNPAWICFTDEELRIIGELATKYDVIVLEDMAYLCMDFRNDMSKPYQPPFQPTVAKYTDNYVLMISGSKIFSYAGERIAIACISNKLYSREYPELRRRYGIGSFGDNYMLTYCYVCSSGCSHSAQYAIAAMFKAAADGTYDFVSELREYGRRAHRSKSIFEKHGFHLVYDKDIDQSIGDGFFYTMGYEGLSNVDLLSLLMRCGINAIALNSTGSGKQGIRVCVSQMVAEEDFSRLEERLGIFQELVKK